MYCAPGGLMYVGQLISQGFVSKLLQSSTEHVFFLVGVAAPLPNRCWESFRGYSEIRWYSKQIIFPRAAVHLTFLKLSDV